MSESYIVKLVKSKKKKSFNRVKNVLLIKRCWDGRGATCDCHGHPKDLVPGTIGLIYNHPGKIATRWIRPSDGFRNVRLMKGCPPSCRRRKSSITIKSSGIMVKGTISRTRSAVGTCIYISAKLYTQNDDMQIE